MSIDNTSTPPDFLSPSVATELNELDAEEIRAVLDYVESLSNARSKPASMIEAGPSEEIVSIEDHETHTTVIKRWDCTGGCDECPHGSYLFHVRFERYISGKEGLHWIYIGKVVDKCTS